MAHIRRGRKRVRAHANPFSDADVTVPMAPRDIPWSEHFALEGQDKKLMQPNVCDVGCGFGGLLLELSSLLPESKIVGLEIRPQAVAIVENRLKKARQEGKAKNACVLLCNVMKHFAHYFNKGQLDKIFFTFADPHFKKGNHRRRIINESFLAYYAFALKVGGICYTITDVKDLYDWQTEHLDAHPLFERIPEEELASDPCYKAIHEATDESKKVERLNGSKFAAVYRRVADPALKKPKT
mmetsp:Transcript_1436/g.2699  ORF Transcript_1436/g.2699 Transcript_1436/m.2699 type:complete len:240 (-) Transcript_1436:205-924(-)|eukprot:CAMPEP_0167783770 /NCGR_PEP_ID=MMETSP0111_2-20121227/7255_1 /TAXON_ID=91324 /ORGANISM="Lotharella globosa, Strain CCCM811" /LENGTH=239 /DNA_ID=CAMNT_0007674745 /DNA_START=18 /DNA_END=737 /DNA_ORIENTATION=-